MNAPANCVRSLAACAALLVAARAAAETAKLFDQWTYQPTQPTAIQSGGDYIPVGYAESPEYFLASLAGNAKRELIAALQTRCWKLDRVAPAFEWADKNRLGLNYVFADAECSGIQGDIDLMQSYIDRVRASSNPRTRQAKIGNWSWFDGMFTDTWWFYQPWPVWPEHARAEEFVRTKLQVSQPSLYPYSYNIKHVTTGDSLNGVFHKYVGGASPNERSAQFWAPLEILSSAKRRLPRGQELIPYVSDYLHVKGFDPKPEQMLTDADYAASILHYRLRGADGLYAWSEKNDARYLKYRKLVAGAWKSLDDFFARAGSLVLLNAAENFGTHKSAGVEWSAALKGNRVVGVISNLSNAPRSIDWTQAAPPTGMPSLRASILALPPNSPMIAAGSHALVQYRTSYRTYETFESFSIGESASWRGPAANVARWSITAPQATGNRSTRVVATTRSVGGQDATAWFKMSASTGFSDTDRVSYSAMFYFDRTALHVAPFNSSGLGDRELPDESRCGPELGVDARDGDWRFNFRKVAGNHEVLRALNRRPAASHWYEFRLDVDPTEGAGAARVWIRDVTSGERDFTILIWSDASANNRIESVQLSLTANRNPSNFDAWQVGADGAAQFDDFNAGYFVPTQDENFSRYDVLRPLASQGWKGSNAAQWEIKESGIRPSAVAVPKAGAQGVGAGWKTNSPEFEAADVVVYSAVLTGGAGFSPAAIASAGAVAAGPVFSLGAATDAGFFFQARAGSERFKALSIPTADHRYDVQVVIDPARAKGIAKIYVRDITANGQFSRLEFAHTGKAPLLELPLELSADNTTTRWDGWWIRGENSAAQIGELRATLYPFKDFLAGGAVDATMIGPNP